MIIKNFIEFNFYNMIKSINMYEDEYHQNPVLLMNTQTFNILKTNHEDIMKTEIYKQPTVPQLCGCYISIADWLSFGEVDIR